MLHKVISFFYPRGWWRFPTRYMAIGASLAQHHFRPGVLWRVNLDFFVLKVISLKDILPILKCPSLQYRLWDLRDSPHLVQLCQCDSASISYFCKWEGERKFLGPLWVSATDLQGAWILVTRKLLSPPCHYAPSELAPKRVCVGDLIYCLSIRAESHWTHRQNMTSRSGKQ